ncbi:hypothetical protein NDU88_002986 [Pleurodeles waltl]|uniref:Uncharacterized protein n=1 Tax=Pleurodeles waltl TaxID=8319 RepID=A0AAV7LFM8_PLEWA|nr:hypothetical protein NDU88_002986 [Pleurodeles waltl]
MERPEACVLRRVPCVQFDDRMGEFCRGLKFLLKILMCDAKFIWPDDDPVNNKGRNFISACLDEWTQALIIVVFSDSLWFLCNMFFDLSFCLFYTVYCPCKVC